MDIRKNLDEGKVGCGIFVDLQKAFDTVDYNISLAKLEHYGISGVANYLNPNFLIESNLSLSMDSILIMLCLNMGFLKALVLGPILFLIYINYLNHAINNCKVQQTADDTNLLHFNSSTKKLNKLVNLDMKHPSV